MSKPFLIIQLRPEDETAGDELAAIQRHGGLGDDEVVQLRAEVSGLGYIDLDRYAGIIVGGSPFDVSTPVVEKSEIQRQIERDFQALFTQVEQRDFPFLGCCSGNGLLGSYCGATISTRFGEPVGLTEITLTAEGADDPLLQGFPTRFPVLLGHKEACDEVPPGSVLLATGDQCPVQMFRVKENIYATQFHPEGDAEGFRLRINVYRHHGYFPPDEADELVERVSQHSTPESNQILRRFVDRYRAS